MNWTFSFFFNSLLLGVGLAMDAFSVSMANGLAEPAMRKKKLYGIAGTFAFFQALTCAMIIAAVTFGICVAGLYIGRKVGNRFSGKASILGGLIMIGIGIEIFVRGVL